MLRIFRVIAIFEGVTTIALFLLAMPLKYWFGNPALVPPVGALHGAAWLTYVGGMLVCLPGKGFSPAGWLRIFVAALFPFGTFLNDFFLKRHERERAAAAPSSAG